MINFFRKIRKQLADDNKPLKYMWYAIGEILLVMIGILLALQVNNWNEENKTRRQINSSLMALKDDLIKDTLLISENLPLVLAQYELNESFRERLAAPGATADTLFKIARYEYDPRWIDQLIYNTNSYDKMATNGLIELLEDSLKLKIINFYNSRSNYLISVDRFKTQYGVAIADYLKSYNFNSGTAVDPGNMVNELTWKNVRSDELAPTFNRLTTYKKFLFSAHRDELQFSLEKSRDILKEINQTE